MNRAGHPSGNQCVITGATIFTGSEFVDGCALVIEGESIAALVPESVITIGSHMDVVRLEGGVLAPGFMDLQVNGGGGAFFTKTPSLRTLETMLQAHRHTGTTSMLPTLISDTPQVHQAGVDAIMEAIGAGLKGVLGIHIEGPFFNVARRGAHHEHYIRAINSDDLEWLTKPRDCKVMVTLAPECVAQGDIKQLVDAGVVVCAGHTDASYANIAGALEEGLTGFTHLYNAMRPAAGREPGVVGAALEDKHSWCGIIIDQHHVHAAMARIAYAAKPQGKVFLVTDAMSTVGAEEKRFELYGETITEQDGYLINAEGRLAGSAIGMMDAVRLNTEWVGVELGESLRMASLYPAQFMQLDHVLGRIQPGYRADLVHFTRDYQVTHTWVAGDKQQHG